jgi:hypothetical protein
MTYVRDSFWRGREFASLTLMQADAVRWSTEVAGLRYSRAWRAANPAGVEAIEPSVDRACRAGPSTVTLVDRHRRGGCAPQGRQALYSVPWRLIGQRLHARTAGDIVQIFAGAEVVATHVRRPSGRSTDFSHYPPEKIAFAMKTPTWCRRTAELIGPACQEVIAEFMADNAIHHLRSAQGVLGLRD